MGGVNLHGASVVFKFEPSGDGKTLVLSCQGDLTTSADFLAQLKSQLKNGYETVRFENTGTSPLYVNDDILRAFFCDEWGGYANKSIKTLDLGSATCKQFSSTSFFPDGAWPSPTNFVLEKLVLPLSDDKVVPSHVIDKFADKAWRLKQVVVPEGYEALGDYCFCMGDYQYIQGKTFSLPTTLRKIGDSAFKNCTLTSGISLPANLEVIGKQAFMGTQLASIDFPASLDKIDNGAFANLGTLTNLSLNEGLRFIGNCAFCLNSTLAQGTLTIPGSVKYIGPGAFLAREYQDVYFQGATAPLMPSGKTSLDLNAGDASTAFSGNMYNGNNGFWPIAKEGTTMDNPLDQGHANRENYKGTDDNYMAILHYPSDLTLEQQATFTDVTRVYWAKTDGWTSEYFSNHPQTVGKETTALKADNNRYTAYKNVLSGFQDTYVGSNYIWPSMSQLERSYVTAWNGVCWDGVTPYQPDLTDEDLKVLEEAGYKVADTPNHDKGEYTKDELSKMAHQGTRRFVLANGDIDSKPDFTVDVKKGQWWTLCVPFNMTKRQVLDTFGEKTQLCLFNGVKSLLGVNNRNYIVLNFTLDVLKHCPVDADGNKLKGEDGVWKYDEIEGNNEPQDDDIVLFAHESYMIKPDDGVNSDKDATFVVKDYEPIAGSPLPTIVKAEVENPGNVACTEEYRFIGNYLESDAARTGKGVTVPQYSYVFAKTKKDPVYKFRFYTGNTSVWKANKSIVQANSRNGGEVDNDNFFKDDAQSTLPDGAKQASRFGADSYGDVTAIEDVVVVAGDDTSSPVYNLQGKMVRADGSVSSLPKGVYIKAGKKYIIK